MVAIFTSTVDEESESWICKLNRDERLRMCNVVMNVAHYDGITRYSGFPISDGKRCEKLPVTLTTDSAQSEDNEKIIFEESMICCYGHRYLPAGAVDVFTVSQAYGPSTDEVFVYRHRKKGENEYEQVLENLTINVRYEALAEKNPRTLVSPPASPQRN